MKVIAQIEELKQKLDRKRQQLSQDRGTDKDIVVGLVPTMGYLHAGHESLLQRAREQCDIVVLSVYVNPLQFGPSEDLATYPRDMAHDLAIASKRQVDIVFAPTDEDMYPVQPQISVRVSGLSDVLCGASRPGHFDGVATVVLKLFNIVQPDLAYFGLKDAQQVAVVEQMIADFNLTVQVVACPTLREEDGLAKSSRNVYLSAEERQQAVVLHEALELAEKLIDEKSDVTMAELILSIKHYIDRAPLAAIDYISILSYPALFTFNDTDRVEHVCLEHNLIIALAVKFGKTRLIDNLIVNKIEHS